MDEFGCDYECRTVGESITKYNIPDDWCAEFDAYDDVYPIIVILVDQIRKAPAMMDLKLRMIENPDDVDAPVSAWVAPDAVSHIIGYAPRFCGDTCEK